MALVDLIRKYHGLDEEDLFAIDNERKTLAAQKKCMLTSISIIYS